MPKTKVSEWHHNLFFLCKVFLKCGTAQKVKFSIKDFSSKFDHIRRKLRIWSHLLENSLIEKYVFCAVWDFSVQKWISKDFVPLSLYIFI